MTSRIFVMIALILASTSAAQAECTRNLPLRPVETLSNAKEAILISNLFEFDQAKTKFEILNQVYFRDLIQTVFEQQAKLVLLPGVEITDPRTGMTVGGSYRQHGDPLSLALNAQIRTVDGESCESTDFIYVSEKADQNVIAHELQHFRDHRQGLVTKMGSDLKQILESGKIKDEDIDSFIFTLTYLIEQRGYSQELETIQRSFAEKGFFYFGRGQIEEAFKLPIVIRNRTAPFVSAYVEPMVEHLKKIQAQYPELFLKIKTYMTKYASSGALSNQEMLKPYF